MNQLGSVKFCHMMENRKSPGYLPDKIWQEYNKSCSHPCPEHFFPEYIPVFSKWYYND